jgi:gamma-glutamyltranspeptidase
LDSLVLNDLIMMGHRIEVLNDIGRVNAIQLLPNGKIAGAADRRGDNSACGY